MTIEEGRLRIQEEEGQDQGGRIYRTTEGILRTKKERTIEGLRTRKGGLWACEGGLRTREGGFRTREGGFTIREGGLMTENDH